MAKTSRRKRIDLYAVDRKFGEMRQFGQDLIDGLGMSIYQYRSMTELLYDVLNQVSPLYRDLSAEEASIENACAKIMLHFTSGKKAQMFRFTDKGMEAVVQEEKTATAQFCESIIELNAAPGPIYDRLAEAVDNDLRQIRLLIERYEAEPCIQRYISVDEIPVSHQDRITLDFYKRCLKQQGEIIKYRLDGLKPRAMARARRTNWMAGFVGLMDSFHDRPYAYARPFAEYRFDATKIDRVGHRLGEFPIEDSYQLEKLYETDKAKFYRIYFKAVSVGEHFSKLNFYLPHLPMRNDRQPIFQELIKLFRAKRWMSFYALALPQVEGLFSEMCEAVVPDRNFSRKALTHKVQAVRPHYYFSDSYFDYYQYHIPLLRNKFAHTGHDEDFKIKSFDLLSDLVHLLNIFYELDNPLVKIRRLYTQRNPGDFATVKDVTYYLDSLNRLAPSQKKAIAKERIAFEEDFLWSTCDLAYLCETIVERFPELFERYKQSVSKIRDLLKKSERFENWDAGTIESWEEDDEIFSDLLAHRRYNEVFNELEFQVQFLNLYTSELKKVPNEIAEALKGLKAANKLEFHKLAILFRKFNKADPLDRS